MFTSEEKRKMVLIVLYVDDLLIASNNKAKLNEIKRGLHQIYLMKDLDEPEVFFGMIITRNRKNKILTLSQTKYTEKMLERFGF